MEPRTGAVRALVGGRDFDDSKFDRAVQAVRQPGSTFKPIVYANAIQNGRPMSYIIDDSPLEVDMSGSSTWKPQNYDGDYAGKIPLRRALYQSRNVPTIKLGMELGIQSVIDEARRFGITTPIPGYPSIFIGAADVYPIEMVAGYTRVRDAGQTGRSRSRSQQGRKTTPETRGGTREPAFRASDVRRRKAWFMVKRQ